MQIIIDSDIAERLILQKGYKFVGVLPNGKTVLENNASKMRYLDAMGEQV